jgi:hypothetical protein
MSIVVQLRGGLGNQLFQYAAGLTLSRRHGVDLILDTALLPRSTVSRGGVRRWPEQISSFAHEGRLIDSSNDSAARKRVKQSLAGRERALGDSAGRLLRAAGVFAHETAEDIDVFNTLGPRARINSYCNSPAFFADHATTVAEQVRELVAPGEWYLAERERIKAEQPIAVHVRWGDYLNLPHIYGSVPPSYYASSVSLIQALSTGQRPIWLFSDDPAGAEEFLRGSLDIARVVDSPADSAPLENLLLLSSASALVCANSSFSWWAAFLSDTADNSIVFPRPLFAATGPAEPKHWLLPDWIQRGRD